MAQRQIELICGLFKRELFARMPAGGFQEIQFPRVAKFLLIAFSSFC
jgi:hypothetical protein